MAEAVSRRMVEARWSSQSCRIWLIKYVRAPQVWLAKYFPSSAIETSSACCRVGIEVYSDWLGCGEVIYYSFHVSTGELCLSKCEYSIFKICGRGLKGIYF